MTDNTKLAMTALSANRMTPYFVEKAQNVVPLIASIVEKGASVASGGSMTLSQCGVIELLNSSDYNYIDRSRMGLAAEDIQEVYHKASACDYYFSSSNAITLDGALYNVDGRANRVSNIAHGPKNVIIIASIDKLVSNLEEAIERVKTVCAPMNCARLGCNTYCKAMGKCISLSRPKSTMTDGCDSSERICCHYLVSAHQRVAGRIKVVLVGDKLGY